MANRTSGNLLLVNNPIGISEVYTDVMTQPNPNTTVTNKPAMPDEATSSDSKPLNIWLIALGLFVVLMLAARYATPGEGVPESFRNLRPSIYNVLFIGLAVAVIIPIYKVASHYIPNASVRDYFQTI